MPPGSVLVRGVGDVGSAVAHLLFEAGHSVVIHDTAQPTTTRWVMAFADAVFDRKATLEGVTARLIGESSHLPTAVNERGTSPSSRGILGSS